MPTPDKSMKWDWEVEIERLREQVASLQATSGYEASLAQLEIDRLRAALRQALRQWAMYAEMVEANDGFDLAKEISPEGDLYRATFSALARTENKDTENGSRTR